MNAPLCLPLEDWPETDRRLWQEAITPMTFGRRSRLVSRWSKSRRRIALQGYGQWLSWLIANGRLDASVAPGTRATPPLLEAYIQNLRGRVSDWSVTMMVQGLMYMLAVLDPAYDRQWLKSVVSNLKRLAKPSRDKRPHMVGADELFSLGTELMAEADRIEHDPYHAAVKARDGLIIAVLISCLHRVSNVAMIEIGQHLTVDNGVYGLEFPWDCTKNRDELAGELPPVLSPWIERYISHHRCHLLERGAGAPTHRLWISRWGTPLGQAAVRHQIKFRTEAAFGLPIWPHLFRTIGSTSMVDHAPELAGIIPDLLGHRDGQTAKRHYILASGARAHEAVQSLMSSRRQSARARVGRRKSG